MLETMMLWFATKLMFFPVKAIAAYPSHLEIPYEEVRFHNEEGLLLHGWFFHGKRSPLTLLFLHGNAGNIGDRLEMIRFLSRIGWNIFIIDYRGYGGSQGSPTIPGVIEDSDAAYRWLTRGKPETTPGKVVIWGESLGGALATELASREPAGALILQSTFTSLRDIGKFHYPFLPSALAPDLFRSIETIRKIRSPLLVVHGTEDETVPYSMGQRLYEAAPHPKRFYEIPGAHHNDTHLFGKNEYLLQIEEFLNEAGL